MDKRKIFFVSSILMVLILCSLTFYFDVIVENLSVYKHRFLNRQRFIDPSPKKILFWNAMFKEKNFYFDVDKFESCPVYKNCIATHDKGIINEQDFDAILFHGIEDSDLYDLPKKRSISQRYVFVSLESPANREVLDSFPADYFNLTMTYTLNSDVTWAYRTIVEKKSGTVVAPDPLVKWNTSDEDASEKIYDDIEKLVKGKTNMAIWFRSNCQTKSGREYYVQELENYISVDKVGTCMSSDKNCSRKRNCFVDIAEPNYFFYLSFENSFCQDYVTEKFFNAIKYYLVPVVYGGADYSYFAPPNSYINALDFDSPKTLAEYLLKLSKNHTEYMKYFHWKKYYTVKKTEQKTICDLCRFLHEDNSTKIYKDIFSWYSINQCPIQKKLSDQIELGGPLYVSKATLKIP